MSLKHEIDFGVVDACQQETDRLFQRQHGTRGQDYVFDQARIMCMEVCTEGVRLGADQQSITVDFTKGTMERMQSIALGDHGGLEGLKSHTPLGGYASLGEHAKHPSLMSSVSSVSSTSSSPFLASMALGGSVNASDLRI
jgi:hypothetical protein